MPNDTSPDWEEVLSAAGWKTARIRRPVQILGSLDGIETGVRQLIRDEPLETAQVEILGQRLTVPTEAKILGARTGGILRREDATVDEGIDVMSYHAANIADWR